MGRENFAATGEASYVAAVLLDALLEHHLLR